MHVKRVCRLASKTWLLEYLLRISVIYPWAPNIEAFVGLFKNSAPRIVISANLHNVFEVGIVPLVLNMLSADGKTLPLKDVIYA